MEALAQGNITGQVRHLHKDSIPWYACLPKQVFDKIPLCDGAVAGSHLSHDVSLQVGKYLVRLSLSCAPQFNYLNKGYFCLLALKSYVLIKVMLDLANFLSSL